MAFVGYKIAITEQLQDMRMGGHFDDNSCPETTGSRILLSHSGIVKWSRFMIFTVLLK